MSAALLIDFGSTYTKVTAVDITNRSIMGTAKSFTTIETDIRYGLERAMDKLSHITGITHFEKKLACSSAAGGLRMMASGLVESLTAKAARLAALGAGAKVIHTFHHEINEEDIENINESNPDIFLLCGGTDGGNRNVLIHNAKVVSQTTGDFPVIIAGNRVAAKEAEEIITHSGKEAIICQNVMPQFDVLNIEPVNEVIRELFIKKITVAKGIKKAEEMIDEVIMPTPYAVLEAAKHLSDGAGSEAGLNDLIVIDIGGATTDVHSICEGVPVSSDVVYRGLPEPRSKRTVEGDMGVRYSASTLLDEAGVKYISKESGLGEDQVIRCVNAIKDNPALLPEDDKDIAQLDRALTRAAVGSAVKRHAGRVEVYYTTSGVRYMQTGKDLTRIKTVIGTGGPLVNAENPVNILSQSLYDESDPDSLRPKAPVFLLDKQYIMAAMGLLCAYDAETAVHIMKKEIKPVISGGL